MGSLLLAIVLTIRTIIDIKPYDSLITSLMYIAIIIYYVGMMPQTCLRADVTVGSSKALHQT